MLTLWLGGLSSIFIYPVEDVRPTLKGDTLEDSEHGKTEVVEVGDAEIGTLPELPALRSLVAFEVATAQCRVVFVHHFSWKIHIKTINTFP